MDERNDNRFIEDQQIAFAMYCDTHALDRGEGYDLAERVGQEVERVAIDRVTGDEG